MFRIMLDFAYFTSSIKIFSQVPIETILYGKLIEFVVQMNVFYVDWKKLKRLYMWSELIRMNF